VTAIVIYVRLDELLVERQRENGEDKPLSLRELAERAQVPRESLRRFAANKMERVPLDLVENLCLFLKCDIGELMILRPEQNNES
jgi:DNA-binding Xre family transcriptional regulator